MRVKVTELKKSSLLCCQNMFLCLLIKLVVFLFMTFSSTPRISVSGSREGRLGFGGHFVLRVEKIDTFGETDYDLQ